MVALLRIAPDDQTVLGDAILPCMFEGMIWCPEEGIGWISKVRSMIRAIANVIRNRILISLVMFNLSTFEST